MLSLAGVNKLILSDFSDRWEYSPIIWDMHNSHADIDKVLKDSEVKLVVSPIVEFLMVEPLEIPVTMAMRRVVLTLNIVTAEPEGKGNKSTLESVDFATNLYAQKTLRLKKPETPDFVTLDFGEVEMSPGESIAGKYVSLITANCTTYF
jgi:hypothetical protein